MAPNNVDRTNSIITLGKEDQLKIAKQLFIWHRATFRIVGLWPLEPTIWLFHTWFLYDAFHIFMGYVELVLALGNIERVIANITETALGSMIIIKLVLLKYSGTLRETLILAEDGISEKLFLETKEKEIYAVYSAIAMKFVKWMSAFTFMSSVLYHVKPLQAVLKAVLANETIPLLLPYRSHLPFPITDTTTYILVYLYQSPLMYVHAFHTLSASFLITLTLNASGHLAILARRIRSIEPNTSEILEVKLGNFVRRYQEIVRFAKSIDKSFRLILLVELVITTMCLALASYNVLVQAGHVDTTTFITFITYVFTMLLIIFAYCSAGEYLITESWNVHDAYYDCDWLELSSSYRKSLTLSLIGTERVLKLTAGGFYTFSLGGFTNILKSAMAYVSMLRTLVL